MAERVRWKAVEAPELERAAELLTVVETFDPGGRRTLHDWRDHITRFGQAPELTRAGFSASGELVAIGWLTPRPSDRSPRRVFLYGAVRPSQRGRGLGTELFAWQLQRAEAWDRATRQPGHGPLAVVAAAPEGQPSAARLFAHAGLAPARTFAEMSRAVEADASAPVVPPGVTLIPWHGRLAEAVRQASITAFSGHWGTQPVGAAEWHSQVGRASARPEWSWLALDSRSHAVVGYALSSEVSDARTGAPQGWTDELGVVPGWRRLGVAGALVAASLGSFAAAGLRSAGLGVDLANAQQAPRFYERLGYRRVNAVVLFTAEPAVSR